MLKAHDTVHAAPVGVIGWLVTESSDTPHCHSALTVIPAAATATAFLPCFFTPASPCGHQLLSDVNS
jgi:hypothetical protein